MEYTYFPLRDPDNIRLLRVWPRPHYDDDYIHVSISEHKRSDAPTYTALSYVWGSRRYLEKIKIDGGSVLITPNLYNALTHFEEEAFHSEVQKSAPRFFWIDALCVNQGDDAEKSQQVRRMKDVYTRAHEVIAYLGKPRQIYNVNSQLADSMTAMAFDLFHEFAKLYEDIDWQENTHVLGSRRPLDGQDLWALSTIFRNDYFTRVWVLQEYTVPRRTSVRCGDYDIEAQILTSGITWLYHAYETGQRLASGDLRPVLQIAKTRLVFHERGAIPDLMDLLINTNQMKASDPRDKVFALLGLLDDRVNGSIVPGYSKTPEQVFQEVAWYLVRSNSDLSVFSWAGLDRPKPLPARLPSWVPDWSGTFRGRVGVDEMSRWMFRSERKFRAHYGRKHTPCIEDNRESMLCRGLRLDRVRSVHDVKRKIFVQNNDHQLPQREAFFAPLDDLGLNRHEVYVFTEEHYDIACFRTLSADATVYGSRMKPWVIQQNMRAAWAEGEIKGWGSDEVWYESMIYIREGMKRKKLFITDKGYLCHGMAEPNDIVTVLFGGSVPFVLRANGIGQYQLVGECYAHGVMDGEAIRDASEEDFEDFVIV